MLTLFYTIAVALIGLSIWLSGGLAFAYVGLVAFAIHLAWQVRAIRIDDSALCLRLFKSNRDAGLLLFVGLVADAVLRAV
jgi:4-hydroxybenzoate polyprenyltransferase